MCYRYCSNDCSRVSIIIYIIFYTDHDVIHELPNLKKRGTRNLKLTVK